MYFSTGFLLIAVAAFYCGSSAKSISKKKPFDDGTNPVPFIRKPANDMGRHANISSHHNRAPVYELLNQINNRGRSSHKQLHSRLSQDDLDKDIILNSDSSVPVTSQNGRTTMERIRSDLEAIRAQLTDIQHAQRTRLTTYKTKTKGGSVSESVNHRGKTVSVQLNGSTSQTTAHGVTGSTHTNHTTPIIPGAYMGFSPTHTTPTKRPSNSSTTSTHVKPTNKSSHNVSARQTSQNELLIAIKQYVAESFINAFDILKGSLVKIDNDVEQGFRQLYNLDTDHFNAADGNIKANGDKIDRLQTYIMNELNVTKRSTAIPPVPETVLHRTMQDTLDKIVNVTSTLLNITRTINDRTERIAEIKEKELRMALVKGGHKKHGHCLKHHHKHKAKLGLTKQLQKVLHHTTRSHKSSFRRSKDGRKLRSHKFLKHTKTPEKRDMVRSKHGKHHINDENDKAFDVESEELDNFD